MLTIVGNSRRSCGIMNRREALQAGGLGLFGTSLQRLEAARATQPAQRARAKSVMFVYLFGGPSQLETFDLKPEAASGIRGPYRPIASRTPGLLISEKLPRLAAISDRYCVIRTVNHRYNDHNGCHYIQTGHPLPPAQRGAAMVDATEKDWPAMGSVVDYFDQQRGGRDFPSYVYLPNRLGHIQGYDRSGQYAGWLGRSYNPIATEIRKRDAGDNPYFRDCTDEELNFRIDGISEMPVLTIDRLDRRRSLLDRFESSRRDLLSSAERTHDTISQRALALISSDKLGRALDIRQETPALRDRYGRHLFGQSALAGRRLIEAGARFVTVLWDAPDGYSWDSHRTNADVDKYLLPGLDQTLSALLDDLHARGLLDETLVVCVGEMGRTPKPDTAAWGRGHWSYCFPALLAGAGIQGGVAYGRSDRDAAYPAERPVSPEDLACTIYHAMGIDPHGFVPDRQGRPVALVEGGRPLVELFG